MRVLFDEQPDLVKAKSVSEAVRAGIALAEENGRMIVEVLVDGEPWSDEAMVEASGEAGRGEEVHIVTAEPTELVSQVFADAFDALPLAGERQREAGELLESGGQAEAMVKLGEALSIWQSVQQAVLMGAEVANIDLEQPTPGGLNPAVLIQQLSGKLELLRDALENEDPLGLSDTLMYDMPEIVEQWRMFLTELRQSVIGEPQS